MKSYRQNGVNKQEICNQKKLIAGKYTEFHAKTFACLLAEKEEKILRKIPRKKSDAVGITG